MEDTIDGMLTRRRALAAAGTVGLGALLAACGGGTDGSATTAATVTTTAGTTTTVEPQSATSELAALFDDATTCEAMPEQTEGPYYFDVDSVRSDIREDRAGTPLRLALRVLDAECRPVGNAVVEIWHCDAAGVYSGFASSEGGPRGGRGSRTDDETFLRGAQVTGADGVVQFVTVYPGWYRGRTVHIHVKVHPDNTRVLTSQLYFPEEVTARVYAAEPYTSNPGRDRFNDDDNIFVAENVLTMRDDGDGQLGVMTFTLGA